MTDEERYPDVDEVAAVVDAHLRRGGWQPTDTDRATATAVLAAVAEVPDTVLEDGTPPVQWRLDRLAVLSQRARSWATGPTRLSPPMVWLLITSASAFERFAAYATDHAHPIRNQPSELRAEIERGEQSLVAIGDVLSAIARGQDS